MDTMLLLLNNWDFHRFFYTDNNWFCRALIALPFVSFVMPLSEVCYISIFYFISTPIYVYKEWEHIDKELVKKISASSSFIGVVVGILTYGKPLIS
jgi:hypothetical protein